MPADEPLPTLPLAERLRRRLRREVLAPLARRVVAPLRRWRNGRRVYRPVFVTGAMGSGTTLLALSLSQRFDCGCVIEEGAIEIAGDSFLQARDPSRFPTVHAYLENMLPDEGWDVERGRQDMLALYRSRARGRSGLVFDKGPNAHMVRLRFLARCFPEAGFVVVVRDPVVNVEGFRRKWPRFGEEPLEESVRFYRVIHERFLEAAPELGRRLVVVRYEDLVERYDGVLDALAHHLDLPPAQRPRRLRSRANIEGQGIRNVSAGRIGVVRSANERAYARLDPETVARIRKDLGDVTERASVLALRVSPAPPSPPARAAAPRPVP